MKQIGCTLFLLTFVLAGCLGPVDMLGVDEAVSERQKRADSNSEAPEIPQYNPERWVIEHFDDECALEVNKSAAITRLDIVALENSDQDLNNRLFGSRTEAIAAVRSRLNTTHSLIPSMEVVNGALKPFNDGLYASIEEGVQLGAEVDGEIVFPAKQRFLLRLLDGLKSLQNTVDESANAHVENAIVHIGAALLLSKTPLELPSHLQDAARDVARQFQNTGIYSRPIGFYTWTQTLQQVFTQDRFLQNYQGEGDPWRDTEFGKFVAMGVVLQNDDELLAEYERILALYARLTNPNWDVAVNALWETTDDALDLQHIDSVKSEFLRQREDASEDWNCGPHMALFPGSKSKETMYFESLFCGDGAPANVDYMQTFIDAIIDGVLDLTPGPDSGWYDYQTWALETLLLPDRAPEASHLRLSEAYRRKLLETFKSILIQNRETHVKQLSYGVSESSDDISYEVDVYPLFQAEPFPTFYLRNARAYRFLDTWLTAILGESFLSARGRLTEDGKMSQRSLQEELRHWAALLYGLYFITADNVGMAKALLEEELLEYSETFCRETALNWLSTWQEDTDVLRDPRVIIPVQLDYERGNAIYWAVIGIKIIKAEAEFVKGYLPKVRPCPEDNEECKDSYCTPADFVPHFYYMLMEESAEFRMPLSANPPSRDEFRAICDEGSTAAEIVSSLEGR
ncbi:MAG: hypothetical protein JXR76_15635 [Deltaproteobacteria bacterium]|nr:hypothetical protein [Deltaproteobacteria bacterium]